MLRKKKKKEHTVLVPNNYELSTLPQRKKSNLLFILLTKTVIQLHQEKGHLKCRWGEHQFPKSQLHSQEVKNSIFHKKSNCAKWRNIQIAYGHNITTLNPEPKENSTDQQNPKTSKT